MPWAAQRDELEQHGLAKPLDLPQSQPSDTWQDRQLTEGADATGSGRAELPLNRQPHPRLPRDELTSRLILVAGQVIRLI